MIIVMKPKASQQSIHAVTNYIENSGLQVHLSQGEEVTIIGIVGDKTRISTENLIIFKDVDRIVPVTESYKLSNRKFHPDATVVKVGNTTIGPGNLTIMAGPCAVETKEHPSQPSYGAAPTSSVPHPTLFRTLRKKGSAICRRLRLRQDFPPSVR